MQQMRHRDRGRLSSPDHSVHALLLFRYALMNVCFAFIILKCRGAHVCDVQSVQTPYVRETTRALFVDRSLTQKMLVLRYAETRALILLACAERFHLM